MWDNKNKSEITCVLAGLILSENNLDVTELNIKKILDSTHNKVEGFWPVLYSRLMNETNNESLINFENTEEKTIAPSKKGKNDEEKGLKKVPESPKESEEDLGFGLFD
jgi:ribosomal protein L12E/L44/L45/RPP1/RPP2